MSRYAPELIDSGFALENADAPLLHDGLNLADLAHVLDLRERGIIPEEPARALLGVLLRGRRHAAPRTSRTTPRTASRTTAGSGYFTPRIGDDAGWLHAGRPRREAVRIALRLHLRRQLADLVEAAAELVADGRRRSQTRTAAPGCRTRPTCSTPSRRPSATICLRFAYPVLRDADRLLDALAWINTSPGGAGCVNGSRLLDDRARVAALLGFDGVIEHTRDAMWQTDGLIDAARQRRQPRHAHRASSPRTWRSGRAASSTT